jgi:hypothetical protein
VKKSYSFLFFQGVFLQLEILLIKTAQSKKFLFLKDLNAFAAIRSSNLGNENLRTR